MRAIVVAFVLFFVAVHAAPKPKPGGAGLIVSPGYSYATYNPPTVIVGASSSSVVTKPGYVYSYGYPGYAAYGAAYAPYTTAALGYPYAAPAVYPYAGYGYGYAKYY